MPRISGGYRGVSDADAHESLSLLFDEAPYGIYRSTTDGRFTEVNHALVRLLGYDSADELLAVDLALDVYQNPEDRGRVVRHAERAHERDPRRVTWHTAQVPWRRKDGTVITVRLSGSPLHDGSGRLTGFHMMVEDVTERRQLEERLRQSQKLEAVGQLTAGIAHDFNNLLTVILGNIGLIAEALPRHLPDLVADLAEVRNAARRGAEMVRKLSAFGRKDPLQRRPVSLPAIVEDSTRLLRRVIPASVDMHIEVSGLDLTIQGDPAALEQILVNLVTNACDAMSDGGTISVDVQRRRLTEEDRLLHPWVEPGDYACLTVADSGHGMDQRTLNHIFEPFFTTKTRGEGTGLGMAMVYGLVKQHAGYIHVYSEEGRGTVVRIYVPIVREYASGADQAVTSAAHLPGGTETVLVVEDDSHLLRAAQRMLETHGYRVLVSTDGVRALETLRAHESEIALVITDMVMPRMGGRQLFGALRAEGRTVPVLFTSGYSAGVMGEVTDAYGTLPFLGKPWTVEELLVKVREVLDDAR